VTADRVLLQFRANCKWSMGCFFIELVSTARKPEENNTSTNQIPKLAFDQNRSKYFFLGATSRHQPQTLTAALSTSFNLKTSLRFFVDFCWRLNELACSRWSLDASHNVTLTLNNCHQSFTKNIFGPNAFISLFNTQTMHTYEVYSTTQYHCYDFLKKLTSWRDSNPGLLFLRRMRCRLRHADRAESFTLLRTSTYGQC
jgi:hypothetical protein